MNALMHVEPTQNVQMHQAVIHVAAKLATQEILTSQQVAMMKMNV